MGTGHGIAIVAATALVAAGEVVVCVALLLRLLRFLDVGRDTDEHGSGGAGGGRLGPSDRPRSPVEGSPPAWWPQFERQFAEYVGGPAYAAGSSPKSIAPADDRAPVPEHDGERRRSRSPW